MPLLVIPQPIKIMTKKYDLLNPLSPEEFFFEFFCDTWHNYSLTTPLDESKIIFELKHP